MRNKWLILALVFSVMVNAAAIGTIGFHWWKVRRIARPLPPPGGPMRGLMHRALSLNPTQMRKLDAHRKRTVFFNLLQMKRELTPEQQEKLLRMMARRPGWDGMGPEFGHGPKPGRFGPGRKRMGE
ncbi:MAG: hypothetical protein B1H02_00090 [Candidatus Latescibacteria bacterium 4484_107]|nr:MAG: hypothetical protein B1H02_00090 [Candidatus Latescibacteria bacterium 4484_107]